jgi:hypothetical protein
MAQSETPGETIGGELLREVALARVVDLTDQAHHFLHGPGLGGAVVPGKVVVE